MRVEAVIRPVRPGDVELLAAAMRAEDAMEIYAATGATPARAIEESLGLSEHAFTGELAGEVAVIGGVVLGEPEGFLGPRIDVVWLLTGEAVARHRAAFWRASRRVLGELLHRFPVLGNMVDARYSAALRWAAALGAEVRPAFRWGASNLPFHPVIWRAPWA